MVTAQCLLVVPFQTLRLSLWVDSVHCLLYTAKPASMASEMKTVYSRTLCILYTLLQGLYRHRNSAVNVASLMETVSTAGNRAL